MFRFLQFIEPIQIAIGLSIGDDNRFVDCNKFIKKPEFSKFMLQFGLKITTLHINCFSVNFKEFYNDYVLRLENLLRLDVMNVNDRVC